MKKIALLISFLIFCFGYGRGTEMYIPIGQSPGVSGITSEIGIITTVFVPEDNDWVGYDNKAGEHKVVFVPKSVPIWIDRSKQKLTTLIGTIADCKLGRTIEVKFSDHKVKRVEWIKVAEE